MKKHSVSNGHLKKQKATVVVPAGTQWRAHIQVELPYSEAPSGPSRTQVEFNLRLKPSPAPPQSALDALSSANAKTTGGLWLSSVARDSTVSVSPMENIDWPGPMWLTTDVEIELEVGPKGAEELTSGGRLRGSLSVPSDGGKTCYLVAKLEKAIEKRVRVVVVLSHQRLSSVFLWVSKRLLSVSSRGDLEVDLSNNARGSSSNERSQPISHRQSIGGNGELADKLHSSHSSVFLEDDEDDVETITDMADVNSASTDELEQLTSDSNLRSDTDQTDVSDNDSGQEEQKEEEEEEKEEEEEEINLLAGLEDLLMDSPPEDSKLSYSSDPEIEFVEGKKAGSRTKKGSSAAPTAKRMKTIAVDSDEELESFLENGMRASSGSTESSNVVDLDDFDETKLHETVSKKTKQRKWSDDGLGERKSSGGKLLKKSPESKSHVAMIESDEELEAWLDNDFKPITQSRGESPESPTRKSSRLNRLKKAKTKSKLPARRALVFESSEESDSDDLSLPSRRLPGIDVWDSNDEDDMDMDEGDDLGGFIVNDEDIDDDEDEDEDDDEDEDERVAPDAGPDDIIDSMLSDDTEYDTDELLSRTMKNKRKTDSLKKKKRKIQRLGAAASPRKALERRRLLQKQQQQQQQTEDDQLYSNYVLSIPLHCPHPAHIVESTTLASARPPPLTYTAKLPSCCLDKGEDSSLSSLQLETVQYVGQRHLQRLPDNTRAGYFCGDGTGVGKGREIAAIIADNFLNGRKKSVWFTASTSLLQDAQRDLRDIGCGPDGDNHIRIFPIPDKVSSCIPYKTGTLLVTYTMLVAGGKPRYRYEQILEWLSNGESSRRTPSYPWKRGKKKKADADADEDVGLRNEKYAFDGPILFDESHRSKNLNVKDASKSSKTAQLVSLLQNQLPDARIVYVSATGASEPRHLGYMPRLGLWGPSTSFPNFEAFFKKVEKSGIGAMEMVAMEMKSLGMYCSRHLSFTGTEFDIDSLTLEPKQRTLYDKCSAWWNTVISDYFRNYDNGLLPKEGDASSKKIAMRLLWAAHQRFFLLMLVSLKQKRCTQIAIDALNSGYAVVIGLFSTGEKSQEEQLAKHFDFDSLLSSPELMLTQFIEKWYPYNQLTQNGLRPLPEALMKRNTLLSDIKALHLPENPLDKLIDSLGGVNRVAEMTGRTKRLVRCKSGTFRAGNRTPSRDNNIECQAFMAGDKNIAVISEAASIGISLQASNTVENRKRRVHIILQLPWSAEKAVQQLGRTHRSHQASAPMYKLLVTECGGEWRLAATIASRLAALGALTSGDRRAGAGAATLSQFTIVPRYGIRALLATEAFVKSQGVIADDQEDVMASQVSGVGSLEQPLCLDSEDEEPTSKPSGSRASDDLDKPMTGSEWADCYSLMCNLGVFNSKVSGDKVKRFLNRLLGVKIRYQAHLFDRFIHFYDTAVDQAQQEGTYEDGVYDIVGTYANPDEEVRLIFEDPRNYQQKTYRLDLHISRGVDWAEAQRLLETAQIARSQRETANGSGSSYYPPNGFYQHRRSFTIIMVFQRDNRNYYHVVKPHIGHQGTPITRQDLRRHYDPLSLEDAHKLWTQKYQSNAESEGIGGGLLKRTILVGSILPTFDILADELQVTTTTNEGKQIVKSQLQVVRAHCPNPTNEKVKKKYVGILLPRNKVDSTISRLRERQNAGAADLRRYDLETALMHANIVVHPAKIEDLVLDKCQAFLSGAADAPSIVEVVQEVKNYVKERHRKSDFLEQALYAKFQIDLSQASIGNKKEIERYLAGDRSMSFNRVVDAVEERFRRDTAVLNAMYQVCEQHDMVVDYPILEKEVQRITGHHFSGVAGTTFFEFVKKYPAWLRRTNMKITFKAGLATLAERNRKFPPIAMPSPPPTQPMQHPLPPTHPLAPPHVVDNPWATDAQQRGRPQSLLTAEQRHQQLMNSQPQRSREQQQHMNQLLQHSGLPNFAAGLPSPSGRGDAVFGSTSRFANPGQPSYISTFPTPSASGVGRPGPNGRPSAVNRPRGWPLESRPPPPLPQLRRPTPVIVLSDED